jgi:thiamine-phosphate pyrophosphorylase
MAARPQPVGARATGVSFPPLHIVTADDVLASPDFLEQAQLLLRSGAERIALHLRGPGASARTLYELALELVKTAHAGGALLIVNDRVDIALAAGADGVQLGSRSLPSADVRAVWTTGIIGASVHSSEEAAPAERSGTDFIVLGTIYETASHPGFKGAGPALVRAVAGAVSIPVVAIGGITPERVSALVESGARGMAVKSAIWAGADPAERMRNLLAAWDASVAQGIHV